MIKHCNIPNALSLSRIVIALIIVLWSTSLSTAWLAGLVMMAVVSDLLDGYLARILGCQSALGARLDPICDAVFVLGLVYVVLIQAKISLWYLAALCVRYAVIALYHYDLMQQGHTQLASLWSGKWSSGLAMGYLLYDRCSHAGLRFDWTDWLFQWVLLAAVVMQILSWYWYYQRYVHLSTDGIKHAESAMMRQEANVA